VKRLRSLAILTALAVVVAACGEPMLPPEESHTLTVTLGGDGSGTVTFDSADGESAEGATEHAAGTEVTLVATPSPDDTFAGWGGACTGTATTCVVTMDGDKSVTASFDADDDEPLPTQVTVSVTVEGSGSGRVTQADLGIDCATGGAGTCSVEDVPTDAEYVYTAVAEGDSTFAGWGGAAASCGTATVCPLTADADPFAIVATFDAPGDPGEPSHSVMVTANADDGIEWVTAANTGETFHGPGYTHNSLQYSGLPYIPNYDAEVVNGFVFRNLNIPPGATITRAFIQFTTIERGAEGEEEYRPSEGDPSLKITAVAAAAPTNIPQESADDPITSRPRVPGEVIWEDIPEWVGKGVRGEAQRTPDLSALLQAVVDLGDWGTAGDDVMFVIENNGSDPATNFRQIATTNHPTVQHAPTLYFEYEVGAE